METAEKKAWKAGIREACLGILEKRIATSGLAMEQAQESANSDDKSSAGDKYETSRSMGQRDRDMHAGQLLQARREKVLLEHLNMDVFHEQAGMGSIVFTKEHIFFIALGLGMTDVNGRKVILLSAEAPLAAALKSKKKGQSFLLKGAQTEILDLF